ncbi:MAG: DUF1045 domain-containing protein [Burkholderiales bacterium]|nr:DUF1045 domain-containing protein [Burkholderiales bacterium]
MPPPDAAPARHAVYWVPARQHPLWAAGCAWLGRDPEQAEAGAPPPQAREPWRYGFHATLKAPMRLREGRCEPTLDAALCALADSQADFALPPLQVGWLSGFLALRPAQALAQDHPLHRLAERCVRELDAFRAPPDAAEAARRAATLADDQARALLAAWGYPHVLSRWRFHLTLSDPAPAEPAALAARAQAHFAAALAQPLHAAALALFVEPAPGQPLRLVRRYPLRGAGG